MNIKKLIAVTLSAATFALSLTACGGKSSDSSAGSSSAARIAIIAMTMSSSIRVKRRFFRGAGGGEAHQRAARCRRQVTRANAPVEARESLLAFFRGAGGAKPTSGISRNEVTHMPLYGFSLPTFFSPGKESMAMIAITISNSINVK